MFGTSPIELLACDAMLRGNILCNSYIYPIDFLTGTNSAIGASGNVTVPQQISSEADFVCQRIAATCWGSAAGTLLQDPDYTINITIASGRPWFNTAMVLRNLCGTFAAAEKPDSLPFPRLIPLNSTLTVNVVNRTGTAANLLEVALIGFNVYYQNGTTRAQVFHVL